jgi:hypothetical protein
MELDQTGAMRHRMAFITPLGLPWESDPLAREESKLLARQREQEAIEVAFDEKRALQSGPTPKEAAGVEGADTLEIVRERDFDLRDR